MRRPSEREFSVALRRYQSLVDKKYLTGVTAEESVEMEQLKAVTRLYDLPEYKGTFDSMDMLPEFYEICEKYEQGYAEYKKWKERQSVNRRGTEGEN